MIESNLYLHLIIPIIIIQIVKQKYIQKGAHILFIDKDLISMAKRLCDNQTYDRNQHVFEMHPIKHSINSVFYKCNVEVNFQPKIFEVQDQTNSVHQSCNHQNQDIKTCDDNKSNQRPKAKERSILPIFNQDCKYYTSCFIVPFQSEQDNNYQFLDNHNMKIKQSLSEVPLQDILVPKPRSKTLYCAVCKLHYEDYLEHIYSTHHKKSIKKSQFNPQIQKLFSIVKSEGQNQGILTRSRRRIEQTNIYYELDLKSNKKRKIQKIISHPHPSKLDENLFQNTSTYVKKQALQTTGKSSLNLLE